MAVKEIFLVTGATGFIGAVLVRKLVERNEAVHIIIRQEAKTWRIDDILNRVQIHRSNLIDVNELKKIFIEVKPTIIYHLATNGAYSDQNDADKIIETNFLGTWNLLQAANSIPYKLFVNTGSSSEYGFKNKAMNENDILRPNSYYAVTKAAQSMLCQLLTQQNNKPIVTIRPFSVYGPYEEPKRLIPTLLNSIREKKEMRLVSTKIARDYIYVDDVVEAYLKIKKLIKASGEIINIGSGTQTSIGQLVKIACRVTNQKTVFIKDGMEKRSWDANTWVGDVSKARRLLGWYPKTPLETGLKRTWKWLKEHKEYYQT